MPGFILDTREQLAIFNNNISHSISEFAPESEKYRTDPSIAEPSQDATEKNLRWIKHFLWKRTMTERFA
jgi:hypothetical protein